MHDHTLPVHPCIEQYRKQAKELVKAAASAESQVRIRCHHPRWRTLSTAELPPLKLADAQLIIAREHGFVSWVKFTEHITSGLAAPPMKESAVAISERGFLQIAVVDVELDAELVTVGNATALVVLLHADGSQRFLPAARYMATGFNQAGFSTLSVDLLTFDEEIDHADLATDVPLLGARSVAVIDWLTQQPGLLSLAVGLWAAHIGAAAAMVAAVERTGVVRAVVSSGGRPDLAGSCLWKIQAPTLLVAAGNYSIGLGFNRFSQTLFPRQTVCDIKVISGADQQLSTPAAREQTTALACDWFKHYLLPRKEG